MKSDRPPQTILQAVQFGWVWLNLECLSCRRRASKHFNDFQLWQASTSLAQIARQFRCAACGGKEIRLGLGTYLSGSGQPVPHTVPIEVEGDQVVPIGRH